MREGRVEVAVGLREAFLKRHKKDAARAEAAWSKLESLEHALTVDPFAGTQIPKDRIPQAYRERGNLWKLDLPHAFRAVYSVLGRPGGERIVAIVRIGDHHEYDRLFGYG